MARRGQVKPTFMLAPAYSRAPLSTLPMAAYSAPLALAPSARRGLLDTGLRLFEEQGFSHVSLADIATAAGQPLAEIYRHFGSKDDFVLGLYQRIHDELEARVSDLPAGPLALRFQALVLLKLELLTPHQGTLRAQMAALLDADQPTGVLSPATESIRLRHHWRRGGRAHAGRATGPGGAAGGAV